MREDSPLLTNIKVCHQSITDVGRTALPCCNAMALHMQLASRSAKQNTQQIPLHFQNCHVEKEGRKYNFQPSAPLGMSQDYRFLPNTNSNKNPAKDFKIRTRYYKGLKQKGRFQVQNSVRSNSKIIRLEELRGSRTAQRELRCPGNPISPTVPNVRNEGGST